MQDQKEEDLGEMINQFKKEKTGDSQNVMIESKLHLRPQAPADEMFLSQAIQKHKHKKSAKET